MLSCPPAQTGHYLFTQPVFMTALPHLRHLAPSRILHAQWFLDLVFASTACRSCFFITSGPLLSLHPTVSVHLTAKPVEHCLPGSTSTQEQGTLRLLSENIPGEILVVFLLQGLLQSYWNIGKNRESSLGEDCISTGDPGAW